MRRKHNHAGQESLFSAHVAAHDADSVQQHGLDTLSPRSKPRSTQDDDGERSGTQNSPLTLAQMGDYAKDDGAWAERLDLSSPPTNRPLVTERTAHGYVYVGPQAEPIKARGRSTVCGGCGGPCFFCGRSLVGLRHEHDHFPIPHRHGGREVVPACIACHDLKDRSDLFNWTEPQLRAVEYGVSSRTLFVGAMGAGVFEDPLSEPFDLRLTRDQALRVVQGCTTAEARVWAARLVCFMLDFDKDYRDAGIADGSRVYVADSERQAA